MNLAPELWVIAGPNGSGKTTLTQQVIPEDIPVINPDEIARELAGSAAEVERFAMQAARQALKDRKDLIERRKSFAVETTLSGEGIKHLVQSARAGGYKINLVYVCLDSPDKSVKRVHQRVQRGGHHVPELEIKRRYERSLKNLPKVIKHADKALVIDNSGKTQEPVAKVEHGRVLHLKPCKWFEEALSRENKSERQIIDVEQITQQREADQGKDREADKTRDIGLGDMGDEPKD